MVGLRTTESTDPKLMRNVNALRGTERYASKTRLRSPHSAVHSGGRQTNQQVVQPHRSKVYIPDSKLQRSQLRQLMDRMQLQRPESMRGDWPLRIGMCVTTTALFSWCEPSANQDLGLTFIDDQV